MRIFCRTCFGVPIDIGQGFLDDAERGLHETASQTTSLSPKVVAGRQTRSKATDAVNLMPSPVCTQTAFFKIAGRCAGSSAWWN
jgi:hypothetical protein